ncbi:MAG: hypothetical protein WBF42_06350, partial [Terracidiphilus sp.]
GIEWPGNPQIEGAQTIFAATDAYYSAPALLPVVILILMALIVPPLPGRRPQKSSRVLYAKESKMTTKTIVFFG